MRANNSTSFPVYSSTDRTLPADAPPSSSKRRLFGQTLTFSLQANSAAIASMSPGWSGAGAPATPRKSTSSRLAGSTAASMDTDTSKKRSPTSKKTPRAKPRQAPSRDKSATGSFPASSSIKKRERARRKPAPKPITPPKKKVRVLKYYIWATKSPRANTELPEQHDGAFGAVFNPYGLKQPKFRLPEFSSLGHSTVNTSSVSVLQQAFGYQAAPSASGRRYSSSPLFIERGKPMVIKKSKANGGAKTIKSASKTKARAASASPPKTTKKARDATTYPAANSSAGRSTNKAIRKETGGGSKSTYMENFARSKASAAATQDTAAANGHKKKHRLSVSTKTGSTQDDSSQFKTNGFVSTPPPRKQRAAIAPMATSAATIKAYYNSATPAKRRSRSRSRSRSRPTSTSTSAASLTAAKTTQDDDDDGEEEEQRPKKKLKTNTDTRTTTKANKRKAGDNGSSSLPPPPRNTFMYSSTPTQSDDGGNGGAEQPPKQKKLKKKIDTRTTKAKRKASGSTSNLPNKFMYSSTPTQNDDGEGGSGAKDSVVGGDTPQSKKRVRKNGGGGGGVGRRDAAAPSTSPTAGKKGKDKKARSSAIAGYDGADDDRDEELREVLFSSSPRTVQG